jgi:hypothetical protein
MSYAKRSNCVLNEDKKNILVLLLALTIVKKVLSFHYKNSSKPKSCEGGEPERALLCGFFYVRH